MKPTVVSVTPLSMVDAYKEIKKIKKTDEELNFRAAKTEEYLKELTLLKDKQAKELYQAIVALEIPRLKDEHIVKILDVMPKTKEDLKMILANNTITIKDDNITKILALCK
ncbi:MAG: hypothetical protein ACMXYC_02355 [Candidatus Woesearchaeota archaeon]